MPNGSESILLGVGGPSPRVFDKDAATGNYAPRVQGLAGLPVPSRDQAAAERKPRPKRRKPRPKPRQDEPDRLAEIATRLANKAIAGAGVPSGVVPRESHSDFVAGRIANEGILPAGAMPKPFRDVVSQGRPVIGWDLSKLDNEELHLLRQLTAANLRADRQRQASQQPGETSGIRQ